MPAGQPAGERGSVVSWDERAACRGADTDRFFLGPDDGGRGGPDGKAQRRVTATARTFCAVCPVIAQCAAFADRHRSLGLYGGSYRRAWPGPYRADPLVPGAPPARPPAAQRRRAA